MDGEGDSKLVNIDPRWCVLEIQDRSKGLIPGSIQEALRTFLQPIMSDDPQLDFYTVYKRETVEYDTEYMQKYNEDLNTTLIFVRFRVHTLLQHIAFKTSSGWSFLGGELRLRHRRPVQAPARPQRAV